MTAHFLTRVNQLFVRAWAQRLCRISDSGGFKQTSTVDKMVGEDDNGLLFSLCVLLTEDDVPYDDLRAKALGFPHTGACWRLRVAMPSTQAAKKGRLPVWVDRLGEAGIRQMTGRQALAEPVLAKLRQRSMPRTGRRRFRRLRRRSRWLRSELFPRGLCGSDAPKYTTCGPACRSDANSF